MERLRLEVINKEPGSTVRLRDFTVTRLYEHRGHIGLWIDYKGRITELDLGPRGVKVVR